VASLEQTLTCLPTKAAAVDWLRDAFGHRKVIGYVAGGAPIFAKASVDAESEDGVIDLGDKQGVSALIEQAKQHRIWGRELAIRTPG
jgi:catalase